MIISQQTQRIHELNAARRLNEGRRSTSSAATDRHERHLLSGLRNEVAGVQE